jgi:hypothetical protein
MHSHPNARLTALGGSERLERRHIDESDVATKNRSKVNESPHPDRTTRPGTPP